jgi:hypothetical protein
VGYFSDKYEDVANRIEDANLGEPPFPYPEWDNIYFVGNPDVDPTAETLVRGKTYYWCVDETDGNNVVWQGPVWSFYVHYYYAIAGRRVAMWTFMTFTSVPVGRM